VPNITLEESGIKNLAKKRKLTQKITEVATKAYAVPKEAIVVIIKENSQENVMGL